MTIEMNQVTEIRKSWTARVIPNALCVSTDSAKHTFASLLQRDAVYRKLVAIWQASIANKVYAAACTQCMPPAWRDALKPWLRSRWRNC